jgi:hypothetical protein
VLPRVTDCAYSQRAERHLQAIDSDRGERRPTEAETVAFYYCDCQMTVCVPRSRNPAPSSDEGDGFAPARLLLTKAAALQNSALATVRNEMLPSSRSSALRYIVRLC